MCEQWPDFSFEFPQTFCLHNFQSRRTLEVGYIESDLGLLRFLHVNKYEQIIGLNGVGGRLWRSYFLHSFDRRHRLRRFLPFHFIFIVSHF